MTDDVAPFALDAELVFRGRPTRVAGRLRLEADSGQVTHRYHLSDGAGAPVLVEQAGDRFALLRPLPSAAEPETAGNTVLVGAEKYTLVGVRRLAMAEALGLISSGTPKNPLLLSGMFEGPAGTLMRELVPGTTRQVYYLVKPLPPGSLVTSLEDAAARAARRAAASRTDDD